MKYALFIGLSIAVHCWMQIWGMKTATEVREVVFTWRDFGLSAVFFAIYRALFDKLMLILFDMETLGLYDRIMMEDDERNWTNIIGAARFKKQADFEQMKTHLFERLKHIHRCRSKMVKFFGVWYFKKMSVEEFEGVKDVVIKRVDGIHNEEELAAFMCRE